MSTKALSLSETAIVLISRLRKWYPCGRNLEPHYLTKRINIGRQSDGFYVTEVVYLLSNVSWWLPCQQLPQTHFNSVVTSVKQVKEKYTDVCLLWQVDSKRRLSFHLWVECFSQLSFDSELYTKLATAADFVYISESNERCEKHSTQRW